MERGVHPSLWDTDGNRGSRGSPYDVDVAGKRVGLGGGEGVFTLEVNIVIVDELRRQRNQGDIARQATVIEPIYADGGDSVDLACGIDGNDNEITASRQGGSDFAVKGGKPSFMITDALLVYPDERP